MYRRECKEEGERRKEKGERRKEKGERRKEKGERRKEKGEKIGICHGKCKKRNMKYEKKEKGEREQVAVRNPQLPVDLFLRSEQCISQK